MVAKNMKQRSSTETRKKSPKPMRQLPADERTSEDIRREYRSLARRWSDLADAAMREKGGSWETKRRDDEGDG
jgi:hypothetical protein